MNRSDQFGDQDHRRTSSYEEDGSNKRRRTDITSDLELISE